MVVRKRIRYRVDRLPVSPDNKIHESTEVLLLLGARRTGKSTLVYQIIRNLLDNSILLKPYFS